MTDKDTCGVGKRMDELKGQENYQSSKINLPPSRSTNFKS